MLPETAHTITAALTQGKRPEAGRLLQDYLRQNPTDEKAWLWLSQIADEPAKSAACLVRVLEIRAATVGLPRGHPALAKRLRRLADTLERLAPGPRANLQRGLTWAGRTLIAGVLLVVALTLGPFALGDLPIIIISGSMEPFIHTGSVVVAERVPSADLRLGDVIAYLPSANAAIPRVHRIVSLRDQDGTRYYTTRGDANPSNDANEVPLGATAWRYWYSVPGIGYIVIFAATPNGKLALIGLPLLGLVGLSVVDWLKHWYRPLPTRRSLQRQPALARHHPDPDRRPVATVHPPSAGAKFQLQHRTVARAMS
jgi:signal peptidase